MTHIDLNEDGLPKYLGTYEAEIFTRLEPRRKGKPFPFWRRGTKAYTAVIEGMRYLRDHPGVTATELRKHCCAASGLHEPMASWLTSWTDFGGRTPINRLWIRKREDTEGNPTYAYRFYLKPSMEKYIPEQGEYETVQQRKYKSLSKALVKSGIDKPGLYRCTERQRVEVGYQTINTYTILIYGIGCMINYQTGEFQTISSAEEVSKMKKGALHVIASFPTGSGPFGRHPQHHVVKPVYVRYLRHKDTCWMNHRDVPITREFEYLG